MRDVVKLVKKLNADEEGAALIEYTVLLGILLVAVIGTIGLVAKWVSNKWNNLEAALP
jgi:pilus assembly protein Flp/PilA